MLEKLEVVSQMFSETPLAGHSEEFKKWQQILKVKYITKSEGFSYEEYFDASTSDKLKIILAAEEHILGLKNGKKRFIDEVAALSKAFALSVPHEQAMDVRMR